MVAGKRGHHSEWQKNLGQGAGPSSVGNTLAAIADGSMAPFFFGCVVFRVCVLCVFTGWHNSHRTVAIEETMMALACTMRM